MSQKPLIIIRTMIINIYNFQINKIIKRCSSVLSISQINNVKKIKKKKKKYFI